MVSEWYFDNILDSLYRYGIERYFKLPLRVSLRPAKISLNGLKVPNDTEWYSMVFNGIPLALFL